METNQKDPQMLSTPRNIADVRWTDSHGRTRQFIASSPAWALVNEDGLALTTDGDNPVTWGTKKVAAYVAPFNGGFPDATYTLKLNA